MSDPSVSPDTEEGGVMSEINSVSPWGVADGLPEPPPELTQRVISEWGDDGDKLLANGHIEPSTMLSLCREYALKQWGHRLDGEPLSAPSYMTEQDWLDMISHRFAVPSSDRPWNPAEPYLDWSVSNGSGWPVTVMELD